MRSVDQKFVNNHAFAAMRSTQTVEINNLPAPGQTQFREADQQILIKALYNSGSPRRLGGSNAFSLWPLAFCPFCQQLLCIAYLE
jgi:hypothetical protein